MVEAKNWRKIFGMGLVEVIVQGRISLEVRPGEFVAIMGPSRWGKSTLLNVLGCLERPASREVSIGRVHVMHKDSRKPAATPPPQNRVCLSKLLTAHYPELSCNVMLPRMFTREKDSLIVERATTLLELVGKKRMSRKPGVLSALTTTIAAHGVVNAVGMVTRIMDAVSSALPWLLWW